MIVNTAWLAGHIHRRLGDGSQYGLRIRYSDEGEALETAGGIIHALPLLGEAPFLLINGDVFTDIDFSRLARHALPAGRLGHLVLVDNPRHHPEGDFAIQHGLLSNHGQPRFTYSGIALLDPAMFTGLAPGPRPLGPLLREQADAGRLGAERHAGHWNDIGAPERLQQARVEFFSTDERG